MKYVSSFQDRHGITRYRFRRHGKSFYLSPPESELFQREYERCLEGSPPLPRRLLRAVPIGKQVRDYLATRKLPEAGSYVYFVADRRRCVKIGTTTAPIDRLVKLATANAVHLRLLGIVPGGVEKERRIHSDLAAYRLRGEWFKDCRAVRENIREHCLTIGG